MPLKRLPCAFLLILASGATTVWTQQQSLADAAKQAKESRAKGDGWALSSNAVPSGDKGAGVSAEVGSPGNAAAPATTAKSTTKDEPYGKKDETYWKDRMRVLQAQLDGDKTLEVAAQSRVRGLTLEVLSAHERSQRAVLERQLQGALTDLSRWRAVVANDKRAIAVFEEQARRGGVPAGWLREGGN